MTSQDLKKTKNIFKEVRKLLSKKCMPSRIIYKIKKLPYSKMKNWTIENIAGTVKRRFQNKKLGDRIIKKQEVTKKGSPKNGE